MNPKRHRELFQRTIAIYERHMLMTWDEAKAQAERDMEGGNHPVMRLLNHIFRQQNPKPNGQRW